MMRAALSVVRFLAGIAIGVASCVASKFWPDYAWFFGWVGACTYYVVVVLPWHEKRSYKRGCRDGITEAVERIANSVAGRKP